MHYDLSANGPEAARLAELITRDRDEEIFRTYVVVSGIWFVFCTKSKQAHLDFGLLSLSTQKEFCLFLDRLFNECDDPEVAIRTKQGKQNAHIFTRCRAITSDLGSATYFYLLT